MGHASITDALEAVAEITGDIKGLEVSYGALDKCGLQIGGLCASSATGRT